MNNRRARNLEWFKTTLNSVRDAIVASDAEGKVLLMNPAAERLTGWDLLDAQGRPLAEVLVIMDATTREPLEGPVEAFRRRSEVTDLGQMILRRRDGSEVYVEDSAAPIHCPEAGLLGFVVVFRDITMRHRQEAEKARLLEELKRASCAKDDFLAMLGHELRNPLAPLVTAVELIKLKAGDRVTREATVIDRQLKHMLRLVNDLLDASRIARGRVEIARQRIEMAAVVDAAVEMVSPLLQQCDQGVDVSLEPDLRVLGDPDRLAQVVANLLSNAAKYGEKGGRVSLAATREGPDVVLTVRDHGMGIENGRLAAIFEPFVQAPQALDRAEGGLGLGLAIARVLVDLHGGTIGAQSDGPGTGSAFTVRLPALEGVVSPKARRDEPLAGSAPGRWRVLIVDDNADALGLLTDALALLGYEPIMASNGPRALALASARHPFVALLDIGLPGMDGYELARRLRATAELDGLKLVALTGYGLAADSRACARRGLRRAPRKAGISRDDPQAPRAPGSSRSPGGAGQADELSESSPRSPIELRVRLPLPAQPAGARGHHHRRPHPGEL